MFEALSDRLQGIFRSLRGQGTLTEAHVDAALREIRLALLEADVHFKVVKQLPRAGARRRPSGQEVLKSLSPDQAVLRIVRDEMVGLLGATRRRRSELARQAAVGRADDRPAGLGQDHHHGQAGALAEAAGTTRCWSPPTSTGPRPASSSGPLGEKAGLKVHHPEGSASPRELLRSALAEARAVGHDVLLVDTAGRLHIDDELMAELAGPEGPRRAQRDPLRGRRHDRPGRGARAPTEFHQQHRDHRASCSPSSTATPAAAPRSRRRRSRAAR